MGRIKNKIRILLMMHFVLILPILPILLINKLLDYGVDNLYGALPDAYGMCMGQAPTRLVKPPLKTGFQELLIVTPVTSLT